MILTKKLKTICLLLTLTLTGQTAWSAAASDAGKTAVAPVKKPLLTPTIPTGRTFTSVRDMDASLLQKSIDAIAASHKMLHDEAGLKDPSKTHLKPSSATFYIGRTQARDTAGSALQGFISNDGKSFIALGIQPSIYPTETNEQTANVVLHTLMADLGVIIPVDASKGLLKGNVREKPGVFCAALWAFFTDEVDVKERASCLDAFTQFIKTSKDEKGQTPAAITAFMGVYDKATIEAFRAIGWTVETAEGNHARIFYPTTPRGFAYINLGKEAATATAAAPASLQAVASTPASEVSEQAARANLLEKKAKERNAIFNSAAKN